MSQVSMVTGSCLCKQVTYEVKKLLGPIVFCHCSFCRKATSSAFSANALVMAADFILLSGEENLVAYESSAGKHRYYCQNCHSQIYHIKDDMPDKLTLKLGTIDQCEQNLDDMLHKHIFDEDDFAWLKYEQD